MASAMIMTGVQPLIVTPVTNSSVRITTNIEIAKPIPHIVRNLTGRVIIRSIPHTMRFISPSINTNIIRDLIPSDKTIPAIYLYCIKK